MRADIAGYQTKEVLYQGSHALVCRAVRNSDGSPCILKMMNQDYPSPKAVARFKQEYEIMRHFTHEHMIKAHELKSYEQAWLMVWEDFQGQNLTHFLKKGGVSLSLFFPLAIQIVVALGEIHDHKIIHKDIKPENLLFDPRSQQVRIINFGLASQLNQETPTFQFPESVEGTLAYMSPEQTGRMNRAVDYRSDYYSLGVTFYELLTGRQPFLTADASELLNWHLTKTPLSPDRLRDDIPPMLSKIILKLMEKNAENRYQSSHGLRVDLESCWARWKTQAGIEEFTLGAHDGYEHFHFPQKLYGRETEIQSLLKTFHRISKGSSEIVLISGDAGVGKTALVQELFKPITKQKGFFLTGKFDQLVRYVPYYSIAQAFRGLIGQILSTSPKEISQWKKNILAALGSNGQMIIEMIPELEKLIGPQPAIPNLTPAESSNRLNFVFKNFIRVFTKGEKPFVIFLDDLQWSDVASFQLIQQIIESTEIRHVMVIGAYRAQEVDQAFAFKYFLKGLDRLGIRPKKILLSPLDLKSVQQLLAEMFHQNENQVHSLSELVVKKTGGNPFFIKTFLEDLHSKKLIVFNRKAGIWKWNVDKIREQDITGNVVELLEEKILNLPAMTQNSLKLAACLGNQFDLRTLALVRQKSLSEIVGELWPAIENGFVLPLSDSYKWIKFDEKESSQKIGIRYKFAHDRIQQAIYLLIESGERAKYHYEIGTLLFDYYHDQAREEKIFDISDQLNLGSAQIESEQERISLLKINLSAGKKAKATSAFKTAYDYLKKGLELAEPEDWEKYYDLMLKLYTGVCEGSYLNGNYHEAEKLGKEIIKIGRTLMDKVPAYEILIAAAQAQNNQLKALVIALQVLKLLGLRLPMKPNILYLYYQFLKQKLLLWGKSPEKLLFLPRMKDERRLAMFRILAQAGSSAYQSFPNLMVLFVLHMARLSVRYGNAKDSPFAYSTFGLILCGITGDIEKGYRFGRLAIDLINYLNCPEKKTKSYFVVSSFIKHFKVHLRETLSMLKETYQSGLDTGDYEFGSYAGGAVYTCHCLALGENLSQLKEESEDYCRGIARLKQKTALNYANIFHQVVLNLVGNCQNPVQLIGESYNENIMIPNHQFAEDRTALFYAYTAKQYLYFLFNRYEEAYHYSQLARPFIQNVVALYWSTVFIFFDSLTHLNYLEAAGSDEKKILLKTVNKNQRQMKKWSQHAPMNFEHKYLLVEAEKCRVQGKTQKITELYHEAIHLAEEHGFLADKAVALELLGRYYQSSGENELARKNIKNARYAYLMWGAKTKVEHLDQKYHPKVPLIKS